MRTLSRLAVLALVALALPASASAADPWSLPAPIRAQTTTPPLPGAPGLAASANGMAIAVADSGGASPDIGPHTLASVFADGTFSDPGRLTPANVAMGPGNGRVLPYGRTRIIGAGIRFARTSSQAIFAFGRIAATGASLDSPRGLGPSTMHAARATMAVNAEGDAAIVYPVCRDAACTKVLVYLAMRRAGTSSFRSTQLADGSGPLPQVAAADQRPRRRHGRLDAGKRPVCAAPHGGRDPAAAPAGRPDDPWAAPRPLGRAQPPPRAVRGLAGAGRVRGEPVRGPRLGRPGARRLPLHGDAVGRDPGRRRRPLRLGGRGARRVRLAGPGTRRLDRLRERALRGPPGAGQGGGQQPVPEPRRRRDAVAAGDRHGAVGPRRRPLRPDLRAHARRRARKRLVLADRPVHGPRGWWRGGLRAGRTRRQPGGVVGTLLSDGRALAAWGTVSQGDCWSVRASPTRQCTSVAALHDQGGCACQAGSTGRPRS